MLDVRNNKITNISPLADFQARRVTVELIGNSIPPAQIEEIGALPNVIIGEH
jgi:hypothetical protein